MTLSRKQDYLQIQ